MATCEQCGFQGPRESFSSLKQRFCSLSCARRFAISHSKRSRSTKHSRQLLQVRRSAKGLKATSKTTFSHSHNRRYSSGVSYMIMQIFFIMRVEIMQFFGNLSAMLCSLLYLFISK